MAAGCENVNMKGLRVELVDAKLLHRIHDKENTLGLTEVANFLEIHAPTVAPLDRGDDNNLGTLITQLGKVICGKAGILCLFNADLDILLLAHHTPRKRDLNKLEVRGDDVVAILELNAVCRNVQTVRSTFDQRDLFGICVEQLACLIICLMALAVHSDVVCAGIRLVLTSREISQFL